MNQNIKTGKFLVKSREFGSEEKELELIKYKLINK